MGIFSELKKLFFVSSSVAKSAADKGFDRAKEAGADLVDKGADFGEKLKGSASELGDDIYDKTMDLGNILKNKAEGLGEEVASKTEGLRDAILHSAEGTIHMVNKSEKLKSFVEGTERVGESILSKGEELMHRGGDAVEALGSKILRENHENLEKAKEFTAGVGAKVLAAKEKMVDRAEKVMEDFNETIDDTIAKGKAEEAREAAKPQKDLRTVLEENKGSMIEDKDDFFSKAEKYAHGDYHGAQEGAITITNPIEKPKRDVSKAAGFTDHDGDGNELIDDAIIDDGTDVLTTGLDKGKELIGDAKEGTQELAQKAGGMLSGMVAAGDSIVESLKEKTDNISSATGDAIDDMIDDGKQVRSNVVESISDTAEKSENLMQDSTDNVIDSAKKMASDASSLVSRNISKASDGLSELADDLEEDIA